MKKIFPIIIVTLSLCHLTIASTLLDEVQGEFKVTTALLPGVVNRLVIENKQVTLFEDSPHGALECKGNFDLKGKIIKSEVHCENGKSFTQTINLNNVDYKSKKFAAQVETSLLQVGPVPMIFERTSAHVKSGGESASGEQPAEAFNYNYLFSADDTKQFKAWLENAAATWREIQEELRRKTEQSRIKRELADRLSALRSLKRDLKNPLYQGESIRLSMRLEKERLERRIIELGNQIGNNQVQHLITNDETKEQEAKPQHDKKEEEEQWEAAPAFS